MIHSIELIEPTINRPTCYWLRLVSAKSPKSFCATKGCRQQHGKLFLGVLSGRVAALELIDKRLRKITDLFKRALNLASFERVIDFQTFNAAYEFVACVYGTDYAPVVHDKFIESSSRF